MKIIGYYKDLTFLERDGSYLVVDKSARKILFKGTEEEASKVFIMLCANFINENLEIEGVS